MVAGADRVSRARREEARELLAVVSEQHGGARGDALAVRVVIDSVTLAEHNKGLIQRTKQLDNELATARKAIQALNDEVRRLRGAQGVDQESLFAAQRSARAAQDEVKALRDALDAARDEDAVRKLRTELRRARREATVALARAEAGEAEVTRLGAEAEAVRTKADAEAAARAETQGSVVAAVGAILAEMGARGRAVAERMSTGWLGGADPVACALRAMVAAMAPLPQNSAARARARLSLLAVAEAGVPVRGGA
jgi:chromosome segregation ATPase